MIASIFRCALLFLIAQSVFLRAQTFSLNQIADSFPSEGFEKRIQFWILIFSHYGEQEVVFHDRNDLGLIYWVVNFEGGIWENPGERLRQGKELRKRKRALQKILDDLRRYGVDSKRLRKEHRQVVDALRSAGYTVKPSLLGRLKGNIRYQRGIKEKFQKGLIRSGKYLAMIKKILTQHRLPTELSVVPHVESSFDYGAYSKRGAAGIWQFMPGTARSFLTLSRSVDERRDPIRSTQAAAQYFVKGYRLLESWPLAITAFNHGINGMMRAKRRHGPDLLTIITHYRSRYFGFASKNFYAEFLAALEMVKNHEKYFGPLLLDPSLELDTVPLKNAHRLNHLTRIPKLTESILRQYNPHLSKYVWTRSRVIPAGTQLYLPQGRGSEVRRALSQIEPLSPLEAASDGSRRYRVKKGDSLSVIARRFSVGLETLLRINRLGNPHRIHAGQLLLVSAGSSRSGQYRIRAGDTLDQIASRFRTSVKLIQQANGIHNPHRIRAGQKLIIPRP